MPTPAGSRTGWPITREVTGNPEPGLGGFGQPMAAKWQGNGKAGMSMSEHARCSSPSSAVRQSRCPEH
jgi:hypothetical protein